MATSTEQINDLIGACTDLKAYFEGARDNIDAQLDVAERRVGDTQRVFNLDQSNGSDDNDGSSEAPLQTMKEIAARSVPGGSTTVILHSDYREAQDNLHLPFGNLKVQLNGFKLSWESYVDDERAARWRMSMDYGGRGFVMLEGGTIAVGHGPATATDEGRTFILGRGVPINLAIRSCTIEVEADPDPAAGLLPGFLMDVPGGVNVSSTVFPTEMGGRWLKGVAAATDPAAVPSLAHSNLSSL